ncbi:MAG: hypothetical protein U9R27_03185 [Campylobacterota bacterium]|nr:hypothetical protein [Campylobacterota bacterium]
MTETLTIKANDEYINKIIKLLQDFPNNQIEVIREDKSPNSQNYAFDILNGRIKDPEKWQQEIREESDFDFFIDRLHNPFL